LTTWSSDDEVLLEKLESPAYVAVMLWWPTLSDDVVNVAVPLLNDPVPSRVAPSKNETRPVAVPAPGE
jgi:hypothetical protein